MTRTVLLGDVAQVQGGYAFKSGDFIDSGVPVLKIKNVQKGNVSFEEINYVSEEVANDAKQWLVQSGDVLISMTGSGPSQPNSAVGRTAYMKKTDPDALINQRIGRLVFKKPVLYSPEFVYYFLSSELVQEYLLNNASGSANQANISNKLVESIKMPEIELSTSRGIAQMLSVIDEKIELNRQMNRTLEQIGQALFKHSFIDNPESKTWPKGKVKGLVDRINQPLKANGHLSDRIYLPIEKLQMKSLSILDPLPYTGARSSLIGFEKNDILVGAMRVYFHRVNIAPSKGVTRTTVFVLRPKSESLRAYATLLLSQNETVAYANTHSRGTTMPYAVWDGGLGDMSIVIPSEEELRKFNDTTWPLLEKVRDLFKDTKTLVNLRDSLLPRLISGKIKV